MALSRGRARIVGSVDTVNIHRQVGLTWFYNFCHRCLVHVAISLGSVLFEAFDQIYTGVPHECRGGLCIWRNTETETLVLLNCPRR